MERDESGVLPTALLAIQSIARTPSAYAVYFCPEGLATGNALDGLSRLRLVVTVNAMTFNAWASMLGKRTRCYADCRLSHANSEDCHVIKLNAAMELLGHVEGGYLRTVITECHRVLPIDIHLMPDLWQGLIHEIKGMRLYGAPEQLMDMAARAQQVDIEQVWWMRQPVTT